MSSSTGTSRASWSLRLAKQPSRPCHWRAHSLRRAAARGPGSARRHPAAHHPRRPTAVHPPPTDVVEAPDGRPPARRLAVGGPTAPSGPPSTTVTLETAAVVIKIDDFPLGVPLLASPNPVIPERWVMIINLDDGESLFAADTRWHASLGQAVPPASGSHVGGVPHLVRRRLTPRQRTPIETTCGRSHRTSTIGKRSGGGRGATGLPGCCAGLPGLLRYASVAPRSCRRSATAAVTSRRVLRCWRRARGATTAAGRRRWPTTCRRRRSFHTLHCGKAGWSRRVRSVRRRRVAGCPVSGRARRR